MCRSSKKILRWLIKGILIALICIPLWITIVRYSAWRIAAFLFFWILCPGIFVDKYILKQDHEDFMMAVYSGFFIGMAVTFAEWVILYVLGLRQLIVWTNPCVAIAFLIWRVVKRKGGVTAGKWKCMVEIPFLLTLLAAVYLCAYYLNFCLPRPVDICSADYTWQIGNINQLASDFPFRDIRVAGVKARYHFFSPMFLAIAKYIFNGEGWIYFAQYQIWFLPFVIAVSFWKLYGRVVHNKNLVAVISIVTMAGLSLNKSYGSWNHHVFSNVNSVGLGVSCLILLFLNLKKAERFFSEKQMPERKYFLWVTQQILFLFVLTGIKGPFALLYILTVCTWSVVQVAKGRAKGAGLPVFAINSTLVFAAMYHILFVAGTQGYFSDWGIDSVLESVLDGREIANLYEKIGICGLQGRALLLLPSLLATFTVLLPFGLLAIADLIRYFWGKKDLGSDLVFSCIFAGGGLCAYYMFHTPDNVQLYFLFAAIPFVGYCCFDRAFALIKKDVWRNVFCAILLVFTLFTVNGNTNQMVTNFSEQFVHYLEDSYPKADSQRVLHFAAYDFLKGYTDKGAMIATNYQGGGTFHEISAFGERRCYLEGYRYSVENFGFDKAEERLREMERLFDNDWNDEDRYGYCEAFGIDYLVFFKDVSDRPQTLQLSEPFKMVYDNDAVSIYGVE